MEIISKKEFDITEYCGNLIVTYLSEDKSYAAEVKALLDSKGYAYFDNEVGIHTVLKNSYVDDIEEKLAECGCYLLLVSKNFNEERKRLFGNKKNRSLKNHIWYQVGILNGRRMDIVAPVAIGQGSINLNGTPLLQSNIIKIDEIEETLNKNYKAVISNNVFYNADTVDQANLNRYTRDRIEYRRLEVSLEVTEENFNKALDLLNMKGNQKSREDFIDLLRDDALCGAKLVSFGSEERLTTNLLPYKEEMDILNVDYPNPDAFTCMHVFSEDKECKNGIMGRYKFEIILPIHKLLGINFKTYIKGKNTLTSNVIKQLFASNFNDKSDVFESNRALYFCISAYDEETFPIHPELQEKLGNYCDYLYPQ